MYRWILLQTVRGVFPVALVYLTRAIVNSVVAAVRPGGPSSAVRDTVLLAIVTGIIMLATQLAASLAIALRLAQSELVRDRVAELIQTKSLEADIAFYDSPEFYDELHRARAEASYRPIELLEGLGSLLQGTITAVSIFVVLLPYGPLLPTALLLSALPGLYVLLHIARRRHEWRQQTTVDNRRSYYYDALITDASSAAEMRVFQLGPHFVARFKRLREKLRREAIEMARKDAVSEGAASLAALLILALAIAFMTRRALHGLVSLGDLALFYQAFNQAIGVWRSLLDNVGRLYESSLFLSNLFAFLDLKTTVVSPTHPNDLPVPIAHGVRFEGVSFRYPGSDRETLLDFNLVLKPGQTAAVVGPNGTGKSTLVKLLCRFYDPERGAITIDDIPLRDINLAQLRGAISVFFQEPVRYNESVAANIGFGDLRVSDQESVSMMERAVTASGANEVIERLPQRERTQLGRIFALGAQLSVGEWQRLALARAYFRNSPLLILDEPTSGMDPWAELQWAERMRTGMQAGITLLITHRFTTAMFADVIHVLNEGRIVESGSHSELLALGGLYSRGWKAQTSNAS